MFSKQTEATSAEWIVGFRERTHRNRIPISATLELTSRCNLRCRHCYLGNQEAQHARREQERSTEAVKASLQEWAEAGCLYLLITGGDPMMRTDFSEIYRFACELGLLVTVFCDGLLVDPSIVDLFKEFPPRKVEISIYGATAETYERVTQVPGSFSKAWKGIDLLCRKKIKVRLKTVLLTLNEHELDAMEAQAKARGLPFYYDAAVFPCLPGGANEPLDLRVAPEKVVAHDLANRERRKQWTDRVGRALVHSEDDRLYPCSAGATGFYADPFGAFSPCVMTTQYQVEQGDRSFQDIWAQSLGEIQMRKSSQDSCLSGGMRGACTHCPAMNYLETGDEEKESDYMIETTRLRYEAVMNLKEEDKAYDK